MASFCIASPHKNELWYDHRLYINLKNELEAIGFQYRAASQNRIYLIGAPVLRFYPEVGAIVSSANNIAVIYSHPEKIEDLTPFNVIYACSQYVKDYLITKFSGKAQKDVLENIQLLPPFSSLYPSKDTKPKYVCDLSFIGTPRIRPILEAVLPIVEKHQLNFHLFGPNWDQYEGNPNAKKHLIARHVPYEEIPMLARGSKICLIDHHVSMSELGAVSHKYIDFVRSGAFVISDNNKDAANTYDGITFKDSDDLESKVLHYLAHREDRLNQTIKQLRMTQSQSTHIAALSLSKSLNLSF